MKMVIVPFTRYRDIRGPKEPTLCGHELQLTSVVKCLGLTLDKGLTWKAQLENVINKAYRTCWTCMGMYGKTWSVILDLHHGDQTHSDLQLHGMMPKGQIQCQQDAA